MSASIHVLVMEKGNEEGEGMYRKRKIEISFMAVKLNIYPD